jgi:hypothetical protein
VELEKNVLKWEQSLYDLREQMEGMCRLGLGLFDQRSLQCVYTVDLFADKDGKSTLFASRKMHGEEKYTCNPDEFGIDITTFKENAYRLTRSQTAASSAMLGAGVGTAVGMVTSGAMGRALDRQKAEKAAKEAAENQSGGTESLSKSDDKSKEESPSEENGVPAEGKNSVQTAENANSSGETENQGGGGSAEQATTAGE